MNNQKLEQENRNFFGLINKLYGNPLSRIYFNRKIRRILKLASIRSNSKVLDLGSGAGILLESLSKDESLELYGVDISKEMLNVAKKKEIQNLTLINDSSENLLNHFSKDSFDYIFMEDSFHHIPNQKQTLSILMKLLKNKGKLIISDFNFGIMGNKIFHKLEPGNSGMYTLLEFRVLLEVAGYRNIVQKRIGLFSIYSEGRKIDISKMKGGKK